MALSGWNPNNIFKLTIDGSKIEGDLTNFPINVTLSSGTGITGFDASAVFDELTSSSTDSYTKLLLHMDDPGLIDSSGYSHTTTLSGNVSASSTQSKFGGYSAYFVGVGDYLSVPDHDDWNLGSGNFTIDFWIRFGATATIQIIWEQAYADPFQVFYWNGPGGNLVFNSTNTGSVANYDWLWTPTISTWYHIALIRNGTSLNCYVDGVRLVPNVTTPISTNTLPDASAVLTIGARSTGIFPIITGYIDEFRWSKGIARWTSSFIPPEGPYGSSWDNRKKIAITDSDDNQLYTEIERWDYINEEANLWVKVPTIVSGTDADLYLYYDATTSGNTTYVGDTGTTPAHTVWDGNFVGVWHMTQDPEHDQSVLYSPEVVGTTANPSQAIHGFSAVDCTGLTKANGMLKVELKASNPAIITVSSFEITSSATYDSEEWAHLLTSEELAKLSTSYQVFYIPLSDCITTAGELDVSQIDYIRWWASTTGANVTIYWKNAELIWPASSVILDSTSNLNHGVSGGSMTSADLVDGKVGKALDFDGINDYITLGNNTFNGLTANSLSVEAIFKPDTLPSGAGSYERIIDLEGRIAYLQSDDDDSAWKFGFYNGSALQEVTNSTNYTTGSYIYFTGVWDKTDNDIHLYINGGNLQSANCLGTPDNSQDRANVIGLAYDVMSRPSDGIIDEVRISSIERNAAWIKATYYSNWNDFVTFSTTVNFTFSSPIPVDLSTVYGTTKQLYLTTTVTGSAPSYIYNAYFYNAYDDGLIDTVSGVQSGQPADVLMSTPSGINYQWYVTATSSGSQDTSDIYTFTNRFLCSGQVQVSDTPASGIPVRLYLRDTGEYIGGTTSAGVSGTFEIETTHNDYHYVVALYGTSNTNALIEDWLIPD